jgi:murein DD-endopeptidase MepM/ murein hydrolase activator NlpD
VRVELQQGDRVEVLADRSYPHRTALRFWGARTERDTIEVDVGREVVRDLKAGPAAVRVTADRAASWLGRSEPVVASVTLPVRLTPPSLELQSSQVYVAQGGCETVTYRVGDSSVRDGVRVGEWWFPGFPLPGGPKQNRFALFAVPYSEASPAPRLVASDDAGNEAELSFVEKFFPKPFRSDRLELSEAFMRKVVPEIVAQTPDFKDRGGLLENYLAINGELRRKNAGELRELAAGSRQEFLWTKPFLRMPNSQPMASFADRRTYVLEGRDVDRQDHLGFDLAVTKHAPVPAANRGCVVLARYFGIYGNTVVLDHGFGLMSLYGHLASIAVQPDQVVEIGQNLGQTGETGLAGGDHLHFAILLAGLPVSPMEWWDGHWIQDRIARKLGPALPFAP